MSELVPKAISLLCQFIPYLLIVVDLTVIDNREVAEFHRLSRGSARIDDAQLIVAEQNRHLYPSA